MVSTTTSNGVWQPLTGSLVITVHVPGTEVTVHWVPENKPGLTGILKVLLGGNMAYCTAPLVLLPAVQSVVVFAGEQPKVKFVVLDTVIVGYCDIDVTVTVFMVLQPFTLFTVNTVVVPGLNTP